MPTTAQKPASITQEFWELLQSQPVSQDPSERYQSLQNLYGYLIGEVPPMESIQDPYLLEISRHLGIPVKTLKKEVKALTAEASKKVEVKEEEPDWKSQLQRSNGHIKGTIGNAMLYLANEWAGFVGYNEFKHAAVWLKEPQWDETEKSRRSFKVGQDLEDEDAGRLQSWLGRRGCDVSYDTAFRALDLAAQNNSFHPIRDYLQGLTWDGKKRVEGFYTTYYKAGDTEYNQIVSRIQLVSSVARIMKPGCKVDTMVILEGDQGLKGSADQDGNQGMLGKGKSSSFKALYGEEHFTDHLSDLGSKDAFMELQDVWCAEMAELDTLSRADANLAKKFISSATDKYRPSYGRKVKSYPRQSVLVGSTNPNGDLGYLKDQTGARRYLPLTVNVCDVAAILADRDQIWAEAYHLYQTGTKWWVTQTEESVVAVEQGKRRQVDPWEETVGNFLGTFDHPTVTSSFVFEKALTIPAERQAGYTLVRLGTVLKQLGWQADRVERKGQTVRFYRRPGSQYFEVSPTFPLDPAPTTPKGVSAEELAERLSTSEGHDENVFPMFRVHGTPL